MFSCTRILQRKIFLRNTLKHEFSSSSAKDKKDILRVLDTTLRDGEQCPGVQLSREEKLLIANQLSLIGVDICEAGVPAYNKKEFEAVHLIAKEVGCLVGERMQRVPMRIAGLATTKQSDIEVCYEAVRGAPLHRIHTYLPTSDIHLKQKLHLSRSECLNRSYDAVRFAASLLDDKGDIQFSCEDAGRTHPEFLVDILSAVIEAGATTVSIADTIGILMPNEFGSLFKRLKEKLLQKNNEIILSAHCRNDLGLATANSLEAIQNGARQVEVTCNGIGERAGNACIEEVVMAIHLRPKYFPVCSMIDTRNLNATSEIVSSVTGMVVPPNKAIVGKNVLYRGRGFTKITD